MNEFVYKEKVVDGSLYVNYQYIENEETLTIKGFYNDLSQADKDKVDNRNA